MSYQIFQLTYTKLHSKNVNSYYRQYKISMQVNLTLSLRRLPIGCKHLHGNKMQFSCCIMSEDFCDSCHRVLVYPNIDIVDLHQYFTLVMVRLVVSFRAMILVGIFYHCYTSAIAVRVCMLWYYISFS